MIGRIQVRVFLSLLCFVCLKIRSKATKEDFVVIPKKSLNFAANSARDLLLTKKILFHIF